MNLLSQSTANYTFSTATNGSLIDMSSGTTALLNATSGNIDDVASSLAEIGFNFTFMGTTYSQFSVNSNGQFRFGTTIIGGGGTAGLVPTTGVAYLQPMTGDQILLSGTSAKVHFKVNGTSPNRSLVVEWKNIRIPYSTSTGTYSTFQLVIYEASGAIEFIYGGMYNNSTSALTRGVFISSGSTSGKIGSVETIEATPTYNATTVSPATSSFTLSANMSNLHSSSDGNRRVFTFTPPAATPNPPSALNFTSVTLSGMTLNWTDSDNEQGYAIFRSSDGGTNFTLVANAALNAVSYVVTGLNAGVSYVWRVYALNEGRMSTALEGTQATLTPTMSGTYTIGATGYDYVSITAAIASLKANGLAGSVSLALQSNYSSASETFPLEFRDIPTLSDRTLTIYPAATGLSITSAQTTGDTATTVKFWGAKYIRFDGRVNQSGTTPDLTISNTGGGNGVYFAHDAQYNKLEHMKLTTTQTNNNLGFRATVVFGTATAGTLGNDFNEVNNCLLNGSGNSLQGIYATGTSGKENDNNIISGCQIFDYAISDTTLTNPASTSTYYIRIAANNSAWTIQNNSMYQTAPRVYKSGASVFHYGINVAASTGNSFIISGNYIGGTTSMAGGSPMTVTDGLVRFQWIVMGVGTTTASSVQGNVIKNMVINTRFTSGSSSVIIGFNYTSGNINTGTVTGNTLGSITDTASVVVRFKGNAAGSFVTGVTSSSSGVMNFSNNKIGGISVLYDLSTAYASFFGFSLTLGTHTVADNTVGSSTVLKSIKNHSGLTATSTINTHGIRFTSGTNTITGNTVANLDQLNGASGATGSSICGIYGSVSTTAVVITNNNVFNLSINSFSTTATATTSCAGIVSSGAASGQIIKGNTIYNLNNSQSSSNPGVFVTGLYYSGSATAPNYIERNFIHSLKAASNTGTISGFYPAGGTYMFKNNMIRLGIDETGAAQTIDQNIYCVNKTIGTSSAFYHNSFFIGGSITSATKTTAAFRKVTATTSDTLKNNIFVNLRQNSVSSAFHYAILLSAANTASANLNNNLLFAPNSGGAIGSNDGGTTPKITFNDWKGLGYDAASLNYTPNFVNATSGSPDLHIQSPTAIEGTGVAIAHVDDDFDGQLRSGLTPTDIGADAGNFTPLDIAGPTINYTNLSNSANLVSLTLSNVTITDNSGVNVTAGTAPRIYYKRSTDDNAFAGNTDADNGWKWVESSTGSSPFSFTLDYSLLFGGGVATGNVIQYFVIAQDLAGTPNIGINSGTIAGTPSSVDLQSDNGPIGGTIKSYTISPSITGEILVGTGQTYTSLTKSDGLFNAINTRVVTGNLTVKITSDLAEDGAVALNQSVEEAIYTIKIVPNDATLKTISGAVANGMIRLNGADGVVFDGRFNETGSTSYLTFRNTNTSNPVFTLLNSSSSNIIRNCVIEGASTSTANAVVFFSTGDNTGNQIMDSQIRDLTTTAARPLYGVYFNALTNNNNTIKNCSIFNFTTAGVYVNAGTNVTVESNLIYMTSASTVATVTGVYAQSAPGLRVVKNKIYDLNGSASAAIRGLYYGGVSSTSMIVTMENNLIQLSPSTTGTVDGIDYFGYSTNSLNLYFNSIYIGGTLTSGANGSYGIRKRDVALAFDLKNNVVQNARSNSGGTGSHYAINFSTTTVTTLTMNYNDYYTSGTGGVLGYWSSNKTTIADWRTASSQDANSLNADPLFRAADNLQPFVGSPLLAGGTPVSGITTDYTGATRNATNPSIGAYETGYTPPGVDWANLQWPATMSLKEGVKGDVYAQVYKAGVTEPAGQGAGISVWIGVSATNTNPNTWTSWTAATFNTQSGNNDEYTAQIGGTLAEGTYYYASRILLEGGIYQYGGYNGGFWDGTTNVSGVLTVTNGEITYANLQFPSTASINEGGSATVYGRVYADGVTNVAGASGIVAELGWSATNNNPNLWTNWTTASFNVQVGNNDEYQAAFGSSLTTGTYYYAYRFKLANDAYYYGGYSGTGGGAWDGTTNISGVLTVNPFIANVPYLQNFDGVTAPALPAGWTVLDANSDTYKWSNAASNPRTSPNAMKAVYNSAVNTVAMDDWFFSPGVNLTAGVEYEVVFYYRAESATYPEKLEVKWGNAANVAGMTGGTLFTNSSITNITYSKGSGSFTPSSSGVYYIGFHGFSLADMFNLYVDDVLIRVKPVATNSQTIAANNTTLFTFTGTGAQVQFTTGNTGSVTLQFEKIPGNPRGTLPSPVLNVANTYWTGTITSGTVTGTYTLTLDLTGVPGIGNPATIHLLKRSDINGSWVDIGYPTDVSAFPLVSWANITSGFSDFGLGGENDNPLPVELVNFSAKAKSRNVNLTWETKTETDNSGFEVERKDKNGDWKKIGFVEGFGSSNSPKYYAFEDKKLSSGKHNYRLKQIDNDGTTSYSDEVEVTIDLPTEFALSQNYPNPFNPSTKVDYQLAMDAKVTIELYSITGEKVATLLSQELEAGYYSMMIDSYTHGMASGIYIYRMIATDALGKSFVSTKKLSLIK